MRGLERRLAALEKASRALAPDETIWSIALNTGEGDFMFVGGEWLPCPNAAELFQQGLQAKVYIGMTLRALIGPTDEPSPDTPEPVT